jgi:hypothetical protein
VKGEREIHPVGTGFLHLADPELENRRFGAVVLKDALTRVIPLSNIPMCTHATLVAVRLEIRKRKERLRKRGPGRVVTTKVVEIPHRLGSGRPWTIGGTDLGGAYAIGVEPDRPGHTGPWLRPDTIIACRGVQVRLEVHLIADGHRPPPPLPRQPDGGWR